MLSIGSEPGNETGSASISMLRAKLRMLKLQLRRYFPGTFPYHLSIFHVCMPCGDVDRTTRSPSACMQFARAQR